MLSSVSIVVPLFNREDHIKETLESLIAQDLEDWQCIIIDDHSTDKSFEVASSYSAKDQRIKVFKRSAPIKGAPACRNEGMSKATGKYLMFLDSDDLISKSCLQNRVAVLESNAQLDFMVNQVTTFFQKPGDVKENWSDLSNDDDVIAFLKGAGWQTSSTMFRTGFVKKFIWNEAACSWQDWEFHLNILLDNPRYEKRINSAPDVFIRRSETNRISAGNRSFKRIECLFRLFSDIHKTLKEKGKEAYLRHMTGNWFVFMEIASIQLSGEEFEALKKQYKDEVSVSWFTKKVLDNYFHIQHFFSSSGIRIGNSLAYRMARLILPVDITKSKIKSH
jgi:glycosyltransferase involved in cell wall biosynthesis